MPRSLTSEKSFSSSPPDPFEGMPLTHVHILDQYQEGDSVIHRLDPRVKLVLTLAFIVTVTAAPHGAWLSFLLLLLAIGVIIVVSRVAPSPILRRSMIALPFALVAVTLVFTTKGAALFTFKLASWSLSITDQGTIAFTSILTKAWLAVLMATLLSATTTFPGLLFAMRALRLPKVIVSIVSFMYRYIFVVADEALRLQRAREARSANPQGKGGRSLPWRAKVLGGMIGSLFLRSYERSERIYAAMLSRGFDGNLRTMRAESLRLSDVMISTAFVGYLLAVVALTVIHV
jgi:cobalt/nickel transport system permease protein